MAWNQLGGSWLAGCAIASTTGGIPSAASDHTSQVLQPLHSSSTALCVTEDIPVGLCSHFWNRIKPYPTNFLQLFLASLLSKAFNSAVLLPSSVSSRILWSLLEVHFLLPISSSAAFADHHSWPQDFLPLLYLPPQWSLLKLHVLQIFFLIPTD